MNWGTQTETERKKYHTQHENNNIVSNQIHWQFISGCLQVFACFLYVVFLRMNKMLSREVSECVFRFAAFDVPTHISFIPTQSLAHLFAQTHTHALHMYWNVINKICHREKFRLLNGYIFDCTDFFWAQNLFLNICFSHSLVSMNCWQKKMIFTALSTLMTPSRYDDYCML